MIASVLSLKNAVNLSGTDFSQVAGQGLPAAYLVKVQGSLDIRAGGYYKFCVTSYGPATVSASVLQKETLLCMCVYLCFRRHS